MLKNLAKYKKTLTLLILTSAYLTTNTSRSQNHTNIKPQNYPILKAEIKDNIRTKTPINADNTWRKKQNSCSFSYFSKIALRQHNRTRAKSQKCGSQKHSPSRNLRLNCALSEAAQEHAKHLERKAKLSHKGVNNTGLRRRVSRHQKGWRMLAENLARGNSTPDSIHKAWMKSNLHCKNIMNPRFNNMGMARSGDYWVVIFAQI